MRTTTHVLVPAVIGALALGPLAAVPAAAGPSLPPTSTASSTPDVVDGFTAGVRAIDHGRGVVTLGGTVARGSSVELSGDVVAPVWTEGDADGRWEAQVQLRHGRHVVRVTSAVSGQVIEIPVEVLILVPPTMSATVDGISRTMTIDGTGHPGAHWVVGDGDRTLAETDARADGTWHVVLTGLSFGRLPIEAAQYFDGTLNGGIDDVYDVRGDAVVEHASASRETDLVSLRGRAPAGTTLAFVDADGPVTGADGEPITTRVAADTTWHAELPLPATARLYRVTVVTDDGDDEVGRTEARVTVPVALTGTVEELPDGRVRLSGTGEPGGTVTLESDSGEALVDAHGAPLRTDIGRRWELVVPRDELPATEVVARQRVRNVEQGALHLVLPKAPGVGGGGPGSSSGGSGRPGHGGAGAGQEAPHRTAAPLRSAATGHRSPSGRLAYTGAEVAGGVTASAALLAAGLGLLHLGRAARRRASDRA